MPSPAEIAEAPVCQSCRLLARLTTGSEVYRGRADLAEKPIWKCDGCDGYVGCHPGSTRPLGTPAGPELRRARQLLHDRMIDPLWKHADVCGEYDPEDEEAAVKIRQAARSRVYSFLADRLGKSGKDTHTGLFDLATCRRAWRALQGRTYPDIRAWAKARAASKRKKVEIDA